MNLFEGTISGSNGDMSVTLGSHTLGLPPELIAERPALRGKVGAPLVVGPHSLPEVQDRRQPLHSGSR